MFLLRAVGMVALVAAPWSAMSAQTSAVAGRRASTDSGVVTGVVFDSIANVPLQGALVQMRLETGTHRVYSAVTDSSGTYRTERVPSGSYVGVFFHPALDRLGIEPPARRVTVGGDAVTRADYAIPSASVIRAAACPAASQRDSSGLLLGRLHDADTDRPLAGGLVVVTWIDLVIDRRGLRRQREQLTARSTDDGRYVLCGVPSEFPVLVRAELGAAASGFIEVQVPPRGLLPRDFGIGMTDTAVAAAAATDRTAAVMEAEATLRRGTAHIDGTVRSPSGDPVADVQLLLRGSAAQGTTDAQGRFTLTGLPAGTSTLEARHLGFAPTRVIVDLASHRTTHVTVTLDKEVAVLNTVRVYGKRSNRSSLTGFLERRQHGFGHFITRADIEKQHVFAVSDLLRRIPGVRVVPTATGFGYTLVMRGGDLSSLQGCIPVVYVDGMHIYLESGFDIDTIVALQDIVGMEVYRGAAEAPPQFPGNGCGAVVIWTGS